MVPWGLFELHKNQTISIFESSASYYGLSDGEKEAVSSAARKAFKDIITLEKFRVTIEGDTENSAYVIPDLSTERNAIMDQMKASISKALKGGRRKALSSLAENDSVFAESGRRQLYLEIKKDWVSLQIEYDDGRKLEADIDDRAITRYRHILVGLNGWRQFFGEMRDLR